MATLHRVASALTTVALVVYGGCSDSSPSRPDRTVSRALLAGAGVNPGGLRFSFTDGSSVSVDVSQWRCSNGAQGCTASILPLPAGTSVSCGQFVVTNGGTVQAVCDVGPGGTVSGTFTLGSDGSFQADLRSASAHLSASGRASTSGASGHWELSGTGACPCSGNGDFTATAPPR